MLNAAGFHLTLLICTDLYFLSRNLIYLTSCSLVACEEYFECVVIMSIGSTSLRLESFSKVVGGMSYN